MVLLRRWFLWGASCPCHKIIPQIRNAQDRINSHIVFLSPSGDAPALLTPLAPYGKQATWGNPLRTRQ